MTIRSALLALGAAAALSAAVILVRPADAGHHETAAMPIAIEPLLGADVKELDGKRASLVRVTFEPGAASAPHRHPGTVIVYVLEGEIQSALNDEKAVTYRAGESWSEPVGTLHRVAVNATDKPAVLLAVLLHDTDDELQQPAE